MYSYYFIAPPIKYASSLQVSINYLLWLLIKLSEWYQNTKMVGNIKPLYLASSIEDLQKQGRLGDVSKHKVKSLCESGEKVLKEANYTKEMGDEEKSYVLFFKYVELTKKVRLHPEYKKDEKYFDSMYNIKKNCKKAKKLELPHKIQTHFTLKEQSNLRPQGQRPLVIILVIYPYKKSIWKYLFIPYQA